ncbi:PA domain protein [Ancylostoma ceylanicum]|uniref:PA domain protein n=1 Tax=Ancylostoma ceylanicum TaxID=53326 RepID=A0A0D6M735_9BILA|nr:PA domain protein [Ancylostoma ceylanicum]
MPSVASQLSIDDFLATEQLMSDEASSNGQNSLRTSRKTGDVRNQWLPVAFAASLFGILATVSLLLVLACLAVKQKPCEEHRTPNSVLLRENGDELGRVSRELSSSFDSTRIRNNMRWMAETSHIAGTVENAALIRRLTDEYIRLGFKVRTYNYSVLLNYPDFENPNTIKVEKEDGVWWRLSRGRGHPSGPPQAVNEQLDGRSEVWWNAYSANGSVEGRIVYCNFGTAEDFKTLDEVKRSLGFPVNMGISVKGAIVLIRYGALVRSEKVMEAERRGAIGAILYSDPAQYASSSKNITFPHSSSLPGSAAQRGSVGRAPGDPLTPLLPALPYVTRTETIESLRRKNLLPGIPVTPIGYDHAQRIMEYMDGPTVTVRRSDWIGGLSTYKWLSRRKFQLNVRSRFANRTITNIIAMLEGNEEPDRWVMLGNHVDAWGKGAIDPISGTAVQLEVARVAAKVFGSSPPRRSLVFCHWDAEEFGLIGSSEWIEQRLGVLQRRAVAYINVDHIAGGTSLDIKAVPLLYRTIVEASQRHFRRRGPFVGDRAVPEIGLPAGGSDYQRFITFAGIPAADVKLEPRPGQSYALYHTMFETPWTVENLIDPNFSSLTSVGQLWIEIVHRLASSLVIPFNVLDYAQSLVVLFHKAEGQLSKMNLTRASSWLPHKLHSLKDALRRLQTAARRIQMEAQDIANGVVDVSIQRLDSINSRLQYIERSFLDQTTENPYYRHVVFSPSSHSTKFSSFSSILDPALDYHLSNNETYLHNLAMAITKVQYAVETAIDTLH